MHPAFPTSPGRPSLPAASAVLAFLLLASAPAGVDAQRLTGFTEAGSDAQRSLEADLMELPAPETFRGHLRELTKEWHPTGSEANRRVADYIARVMDEAGMEVERYPYDLYLPSLERDIEVEVVTPIRIPLNNQEYVLEEDRFSDDPDLGEGWNAFSGSGDVTGEVVYANYGRKEDFERLEEWGVDVRGKVVVARYGGNFRGYKAKYAEAHGAAGLIMYSDPEDGGYVDGAPYPEDRWLSESTIQRGSVLALDWTGDPLTPFEPALPTDGDVEVERLDPEDVEGLHSIPVTPIPHASAKEILGRMTGRPVPADGWQGGLPFTYRLTGGSKLTVRVAVNQPKGLVRATNVVGTIRGSDHPDEWIVLGSHYDPWTFGAVDPNSGTAMLLTMAEALGELARRGERPRRSVMIAHWDAEEYGIIGSTEWVEQLRDELTASAVAYINADGAVSGGSFGSSASPSLKGPIVDAARAVAYPGSEGTVYDHWMEGAPDDAEGPPMGNLGGGSDHVAFYTHVGVPSAGLSMGGSSPIYHSGYDNFAWYERFGDTDFVYGPALARVDGVLTLRLANAEVLPYDVARYATDLRSHVADLEELAADEGRTVSFDGLRASVDALDEAARAFTEAREARLERGRPGTDEARRINGMLIGLEKAFLRTEGLQGRAWSRSLYASPDPFSGYASWMLPGLRFEVETGGWQNLDRWEGIYVEAVDELTERVREVAEALEG